MNEATFKAQLGEKLVNLRKRNRLTLADVAAKSGVPLALLKKYEGGGALPALGELMNLARAFDVSMNHFFTSGPPIGRVEVVRASDRWKVKPQTDTAAALRAAEIEAQVILKATKVDGVYSADPMKVPDAELYTHLTYDEVIDRRLEVMDFGAVNLCRQNGVAIVVFNLREPGNMTRVVRGEPVGTTISAG